MEEIRKDGRDEEARAEQDSASLPRVVVHPHNRAGAVILRFVEAHLAAAKHFVPGFVKIRLKRTTSLK